MDGAIPRGAEAAIGYWELNIVTMAKTPKEGKNRIQPRKANPIERIVH